MCSSDLDGIVLVELMRVGRRIILNELHGVVGAVGRGRGIGRHARPRLVPGAVAEKLGFIHVASGPLVRSSYHADDFAPRAS